MKFIHTLPVLALFSASVYAGTGKAPTPPAMEEKSSGLEWEAALNYDTHYVFRGELLQTNIAWSYLSLDIPLSDSLSFNITPSYIHDVDSDFNEIDLNAELSYSLGAYELGLGYAGYYYPRGGEGNNEGLNDEQEMSLSVAHDIGPMSATLLSVYSFTREGFYFELLTELPYEVNDVLTIQPGVAIGFDTGYFDTGTGFNHALFTLSTPIKLSENITFTPYIAENLPFDQLEDESAQFFGGVKLAITF